MYRSRRRLQPKVPLTAIEFSVMLPESTFATHHKFTVTTTNHTAVIFYSERMKSYLSEISKIQSDGTFYTVPTQFSQLWTIFVVIDRHALPGIHCLMTSKDQELYTAILAKIHSLVPEFIPEISISDWEPAPRNAFKEVYPTIQNQGCWFHFTQRIWAKTQKLGLVHSFHDNPETAKFIRNLMAIPFLPASLIRATYAFLQVPDLTNLESGKLEQIRKYFKKRWITQIDPEELSIYEAGITTNNAAESYHAKLKSIIKTPHPRIWNFLTTLNNIIEDTDNEIGRLILGQSISRPRKSKHVLKDQQREIIKERFRTGELTPWQYLNAMSNTIGGAVTLETGIEFSDTNESDTSDNESENTVVENICVVCLLPRTTTWIFLPCKHANCCAACSYRIEELNQTCPVCRVPIINRFQIYI